MARRRRNVRVGVWLRVSVCRTNVVAHASPNMLPSNTCTDTARVTLTIPAQAISTACPPRQVMTPLRRPDIIPSRPLTLSLCAEPVVRRRFSLSSIDSPRGELDMGGFYAAV